MRFPEGRARASLEQERRTENFLFSQRSEGNTPKFGSAIRFLNLDRSRPSRPISNVFQVSSGSISGGESGSFQVQAQPAAQCALLNRYGLGAVGWPGLISVTCSILRIAFMIKLKNRKLLFKLTSAHRLIAPTLTIRKRINRPARDRLTLNSNYFLF